MDSNNGDFRQRFSNTNLSADQVSNNGYKLFLSKEAQQVIDGAGSYESARINQKLQSLIAMPRPESAGKRIGGADGYRMAVGYYRFDYVVFSGEITVTNASFDQTDADTAKREKPGLYRIRKSRDGWGPVAVRVEAVETSHAAVNGMQNDLIAATRLMPLHIESAFGKKVNTFTLYHNPSVGFFGDLWESSRDKLSITTPLAKHLAAILDDTQKKKKEVKWVVHSQGGAVFVQAVNYHNKTRAKPLDMHKVKFHSGANNALISQRILDKASVEKVGKDNNHPYDLVPNVIGMNTINPVRIVGSIVAAPALSSSGPLAHLKSPHTLPNKRETWKFWQWKD